MPHLMRHLLFHLNKKRFFQIQGEIPAYAGMTSYYLISYYYMVYI